MNVGQKAANGDISVELVWTIMAWQVRFFSFSLKIDCNKEEELEEMSLFQLQMYMEGYTIDLSFRDPPVL